MAKKPRMTEAERETLTLKQRAEWTALSKKQKAAALESMDGLEILRRFGFLTDDEIYKDLRTPVEQARHDAMAAACAEHFAKQKAEWEALPKEERLAKIADARERYLAAARNGGMTEKAVALLLAEMESHFIHGNYAEDSEGRLRHWRMAARDVDVLSQRIGSIRHAFNCAPYYVEKPGVDYYEQAQRQFLATFEHWDKDLRPLGAVSFADFAVAKGIGVKVNPEDPVAERESYEALLRGEPPEDLPDVALGSAMQAGAPKTRNSPKRKRFSWKSTWEREAKKRYEAGDSFERIAELMNTYRKESGATCGECGPRAVEAKQSREQWKRLTKS